MAKGYSNDLRVRAISIVEVGESARETARLLKVAASTAIRWVGMAESELAVLSGQCLNRRIPDAATLTSEVAAWRKRRNTYNAKANWHFTSADARVKLKSLYPAL